MNKQEKDLFFKLCSFLSPDRDIIKKLIEKGAATPELLGHLFANRVAGIAYDVLKKTDSLSEVDREFRNSLKNASVVNEKINEDYMGCLNYLATQLDSCAVPYALLKGAYLCGKYPIGCRTSNDIDVLICPEDVTKVSTKLKLAGFKQGHLKNGKFVEATRQEIIESKMTRGETVPFIKEIKLPYIKYLEVDLNFSLDYKNSDNENLRKMLERTESVKLQNNTKVCTLCPTDFMLHLCAHLYKEATTLPWVKMKRDMTFYKYCDIYMIISEMSEDEQQAIITAANEMGLEKEVAYALNSIRCFFDVVLNKHIDYIIKEHLDTLDDVVSPKENRVYHYIYSNLEKRFFAKDRSKLLEVKNI